MFYIRVTEDENNRQIEKFTIRLFDDICLTDPIMQFLLQKVQHMGHSIELLVSLDRLADIWRMDNENNGLTMIDIFIYYFILLCCKSFIFCSNLLQM